MNLKELCFNTIKVVKNAGEYINKEYENKGSIGLEAKGKHNFVTNVDKGAEEILVNGLRELLPEAGFIAEEGTSETKGEQYNWVIDPIDGTTNFIHGAFPFAVSVALVCELKPVMGVILEMGMNECFYAWENGGAFINDKPISVSNTGSLNDALIATGFPYTNYTYLKGFINSVEWFMKNSRGLRRLGSAATDIAWVACGRYDGFYEYGLSPWDIAAGVIILKEAGGTTSDFEGGNDFLFGEEVICSNAKIQNEFIKAVKSTVKES